MELDVEDQLSIAIKMKKEIEELQERLHRYAPQTDIEAWNKFEKYRWVYQTTKLLEFQNIEWKPFHDEETTTRLRTWWLDQPAKSQPKLCDVVQMAMVNSGFIYTTLPLYREDEKITSSTLIVHRGNVVYQAHWALTKQGMETDLDPYSGQLSLKIQSLLTWHFKKYSGVVTVTYVNDNIIKVSLAADLQLMQHIFPIEVLKKLPALYSRRQWK